MPSPAIGPSEAEKALTWDLKNQHVPSREKPKKWLKNYEKGVSRPGTPFHLTPMVYRI